MFFGEDVIRRLLYGVRPGWESDLRTVKIPDGSMEELMEFDSAKQPFP